MDPILYYQAKLFNGHYVVRIYYHPLKHPDMGWMNEYCQWNKPLASAEGVEGYRLVICDLKAGQHDLAKMEAKGVIFNASHELLKVFDHMPLFASAAANERASFAISPDLWEIQAKLLNGKLWSGQANNELLAMTEAIEIAHIKQLSATNIFVHPDVFQGLPKELKIPEVKPDQQSQGRSYCVATRKMQIEIVAETTRPNHFRGVDALYKHARGHHCYRIPITIKGARYDYSTRYYLTLVFAEAPKPMTPDTFRDQAFVAVTCTGFEKKRINLTLDLSELTASTPVLKTDGMFIKQHLGIEYVPSPVIEERFRLMHLMGDPAKDVVIRGPYTYAIASEAPTTVYVMGIHESK